MSNKRLINLDTETDTMQKALQTIDGWNFSYAVRCLIRNEYKKAIADGKLSSSGGNAHAEQNRV